MDSGGRTVFVERIVTALCTEAFARTVGCRPCQVYLGDDEVPDFFRLSAFRHFIVMESGIHCCLPFSGPDIRLCQAIGSTACPDAVGVARARLSKKEKWRLTHFREMNEVFDTNSPRCRPLLIRQCPQRQQRGETAMGKLGSRDLLCLKWPN